MKNRKRNVRLKKIGNNINQTGSLYVADVDEITQLLVGGNRNDSCGAIFELLRNRVVWILPNKHRKQLSPLQELIPTKSV